MRDNQDSTKKMELFIMKKVRFKPAIVSLIFIILIAFAVYRRQWILENRQLAAAALAGALGLFVAFHILIQHLKKKCYLNSSIARIDNMSGEDFEKYLKAGFERKGYKVELTPGSNDYGADLVLTRKGETTVVQAKRYEANVGNKAVQEVVAARAYYEAEKAMVVTNSYFTKQAVKLAEANDVELWDRGNLVKNVNTKALLTAGKS